MIKRILDIAISVFGILLLLPVMALVAIQIKRKLGSPILFRQKRPGLGGKPFEMIKFRTMSPSVDSHNHSLPDSARITTLGQFLRSTSLDELPELWNVLKGEMSLVGPRPLLMEYIPLYTPEQSRRHEVRPGITGWAQVNGRNAISWEQKFRLDVWYVDHQTFWLDLRILWMTLASVFSRHGVSEPGQATMSKFTGNNRNLSE